MLKETCVTPFPPTFQETAKKKGKKGSKKQKLGETVVN